MQTMKAEHSTYSPVRIFLLFVLLAIVVMLIAGAQSQDAVMATPVDDPGQELFAIVCAMCHSEQPPALAAPPMAMIVRHYRQALSTEDSVRTVMTTWLRSPSAEASLLPAHAIEKFGLMPAQPQLTDKQIELIVGYVLTLEAAPHNMEGMGMGQGKGKNQHKNH